MTRQSICHWFATHSRMLTAWGYVLSLIVLALCLFGCAEPRPVGLVSVLGYQMPPECDGTTLDRVKATLSVQEVSEDELRTQYLSDVRRGEWHSDPVEPQTKLWAISGYRGEEVVWTEILEGLSPEMKDGILNIESCHGIANWRYKTAQADVRNNYDR